MTDSRMATLARAARELRDPTPARAAGKDARGHFMRGNSFGRGRPKRQTEAGYLLALAEACPLDKWKTIVQRAVQDALAGDPKAREWLAHYLIGKPENLLLSFAQEVTFDDG